MTHLPHFGSQRRDKRLGHYENSDETVVVSLLSFRRKCRLRLVTRLGSPQLALPFSPHCGVQDRDALVARHPLE